MKPKLLRQGTQQRVYEFIIKYKKEHQGISPTVRTIMEGIGLSSTSVAHYHVESLEKAGLIYRVYSDDSEKSIGYEVAGGKWTYKAPEIVEIP